MVTASSELADKVLDTALQLAEETGWESLRLYDVAVRMHVSLADIGQVIRQKDDLVEAWFDRADAAMLADAGSDDYLHLSPVERLHRSIMCWLRALALHRRITGEMLWYKFEPGHVHLQVLGLLRISRTVQWFLEAAHRRSRFLRRIGEEIALTSIYLATFVFWLRDDSSDSQATARMLRRQLHLAQRLLFRDAMPQTAAGGVRRKAAGATPVEEPGGSVGEP